MQRLMIWCCVFAAVVVLIWFDLVVQEVVGNKYNTTQQQQAQNQAQQHGSSGVTNEEESRTTTTTTTPESKMNVSWVLGNHMESIEHLLLQPWQLDAMRMAQQSSKDSSNRKGGWDNIHNDKICSPPAPHISTDFCCGGATLQVKVNAHRGHLNNPYVCAQHLSKEHYDRVYQTALRHHLPPLLYNNNNDKVNKCDVCQIANTLWEKNLSMVFLGDSVTHQMTLGWLCDLQMRNYLVTTSMVTGDKTSFHLFISSPQWGGRDGANGDGGVVNMTFLNARPFPKTMASWWDDLLHQNDILVFNFGVHWAVNATKAKKSPEAFQNGMNQLFDHWSSSSSTTTTPRQKLVAFRETSTQHFDADSGEYFLYDANKANGASPMCVPNDRRSSMIGWREEIVRTTALANGIHVVTADENLVAAKEETDKKKKEIVMLPFSNFTAELYFLHPFQNNTGVVDCTHFCQTPFLWMPLWRSLRNSVDRAFDGSS